MQLAVILLRLHGAVGSRGRKRASSTHLERRSLHLPQPFLFSPLRNLSTGKLKTHLADFLIFLGPGLRNEGTPPQGAIRNEVTAVACSQEQGHLEEEDGVLFPLFTTAKQIVPNPVAKNRASKLQSTGQIQLAAHLSWKTATSLCLYIACGCFCTVMADLSCCARNWKPKLLTIRPFPDKVCWALTYHNNFLHLTVLCFVSFCCCCCCCPGLTQATSSSSKLNWGLGSAEKAITELPSVCGLSASRRLDHIPHLPHTSGTSPRAQGLITPLFASCLLVLLQTQQVTWASPGLPEGGHYPECKYRKGCCLGVTKGIMYHIGIQYFLLKK